MASYTRRIERPRDFFLEPFLTWMDAYNVRTGNPDIQPEYIDSYEAGYQRNFGRNLVSLEGYYRITNNKIERVQSVYQDNIMLHTVTNVGKDYTFGSELMVNMDVNSWWNLNLMGNLYDYRMKGRLYNEDFSRKSLNWDVRSNNTLKLTRSLRMQLNLSYTSPSVSAQGRREGYFGTNLAVRQSLLNDNLEIILQIRDIFSATNMNSPPKGRIFTATTNSPVNHRFIP